jgi:RNA polymerase sigma-70 factor, ECF subfamily
VNRFADLYLDARKTITSEVLSMDLDALDGLLRALCARGRAAHPKLELSDEVFVAHLARCKAPISDVGELVQVGDLYLVCACLEGDEAAASLLVETHRRMLAATLSRIDSSAAFIDDVQQRFWDAALVGTISASPRLGLYSGRGSLGGWISVGAQRIALMMRRHEDAEGRARRAIEDAYAAQDPELAFIKERYRERFREATQRALDELDDRERLIFRLHLVDGVTIERIGHIYGVSHSTISRWFRSARDKVTERVHRVIHDELQISAADFESLTRLVISQLDLSISMLPAPRT